MEAMDLFDVDNMPDADQPHQPLIRDIVAPKRVRTVYTSRQLIELENSFIICPYIRRETRVHLAETLDLTDKQINVWFQNRRMKSKKNSNNISVASPDHEPCNNIHCPFALNQYSWQGTPNPSNWLPNDGTNYLYLNNEIQSSQSYNSNLYPVLTYEEHRQEAAFSAYSQIYSPHYNVPSEQTTEDTQRRNVVYEPRCVLVETFVNTQLKKKSQDLGDVLYNTLTLL